MRIRRLVNFETLQIIAHRLSKEVLIDLLSFELPQDEKMFPLQFNSNCQKFMFVSVGHPSSHYKLLNSVQIDKHRITDSDTTSKEMHKYTAPKSGNVHWLHGFKILEVHNCKKWWHTMRTVPVP